MPESRGRRRGTKRPSRPRRRNIAATTAATSISEGASRRRWRPRIRARTWRRIRRWGFIGGAGLVAVLVIVSFALSSVGPGMGGGQSQVVEGVGTRASIEGQDHITAGTGVSYGTSPPTSGNHWPTPAECGIHDIPVPDEQVVHNMEHGHVIISYNLPDPEEKARLLAVAEDLPSLDRWGIVRPYEGIDPGTVGVTAWGVLDTMESVDEAGITEFYNTYIRNRFSDETAQAGPIACQAISHGG